jgi:hypothetical protein
MIACALAAQQSLGGARVLSDDARVTWSAGAPSLLILLLLLLLLFMMLLLPMMLLVLVLVLALAVLI